MAGIGNKNATVSVYVNAEQAKKSLESMKSALKEGRELIKIYKKELAALGKISESEKSEEQRQRTAALRDSIEKLGRANANTAKTIKENEAALTDFDSIAGRMSKGNLKSLYKDLSSAKNAFKLIAKDDVANLEKGRKLISNIQAEIKKLETGYKGVDNVMKNIKTTPLEQLKMAEEELVKKMSSLTRGTHAYAKASSQLSVVRDQMLQITESSKLAESRLTQLRLGYKGVSDVMKNLNTAPLRNLKMAEEELVKKLSSLKQGTIEYVNTSKSLDKIRERMKAIQQAASDAKIGYKGVSDVLSRLKTAPMEQLKRAQEDLNNQLSKLTRGTTEYKLKLEQLKKVNGQIDSVTKSFSNQDSMIMKTMKRLASYVTVYMGFNQVLGQMRQVISGNIELSDSMADIQKVTKMTSGQVDALAKSIDAIDTRSSQEQLYKLGYQAGMLGLKSTEDILGFIKAADQMNWALKELGEDGAVQLMKVANLTHETDIYSVEVALNKIGSAINEITASSAASAAPIVDYVSRLGSVGATAKYSSSELVAIGSTLDSLGVHAEMGSTAMTKFILALKNNRSEIAASIGMSHDVMNTIEKDQGSVGLMVEVLTRLKEMGSTSANALDVLTPIFKDLGSEGTRMVQTLATMIDNVDVFKDHLSITGDAFKEGVSMLNEYNVKNETAAATFARLGNAMREAFVNSGFVRALQKIGSWLAEVTIHSNRLGAAFIPLNAALGAAAAYMGAMVKTGLVSMWQSLSSAVANVTAVYRTHAVAIVMMNAEKAKGVVLTKADALAAAELAIAEGTATGVTISFTTALRALWAAMLSNPVTALIAAIGALAGAFIGLYDWITADTDAEKALDEAQQEHTKTLTAEKNALGNVFEKLEKVKNSEDERRKLIKQINQQYAPYMKNLLNEKASYDQIRTALEGVNEQLEINAAIKLKNKLDESAGETLAKEIESIRESASDNIDSLISGWEKKLKDGKTISQLKGAIQGTLQRAADMKTISNYTAEKMIKNTIATFIGDSHSYSMYEGHQVRDLIDDIMDLREAQKSYNEQIEENKRYAEAALNGMSFEDAQLKQIKKSTEEATQAQQEFVDTSKRITTIAGQDATILKGWYDNLINLGKIKKDAAEFRTLFKETFGEDKLKTVLDKSGNVVGTSAQKIISEYAENIKRELAKQGLTTELGHKSPSKEKSSNEKKESIKKEMQETFNYLRAYYNDLANDMRMARAQNPALYSEEEMNEDIRKIEEEYQKAYKQLGEFMLNQSSSIKGNAGFMSYLAGKDSDIEKTKERIQSVGKDIWDDITKNMTEAERKQLDSLLKHMSDMEKIIKKYDFVEQTSDQFRASLIQYGLYNEAVFEQLKEQARGKEQITADGLMQQYNITRSSAEALLILMSDFHDAEIEAIKKQNDRVAKLTKQDYDERAKELDDYIKQYQLWASEMKDYESDMGTGNQHSLDLELSVIQLKMEKQREYLEVLRSQLEEEWAMRLGLAEKIKEAEEEKEYRLTELQTAKYGEDAIAEDPELLAIQARIDGMNAEIEAKVGAAQAYRDAESTLTEIMLEEADKQREIQEEKQQWIKDYADIVASNAEDIGESFWGEADDMKEAGKQLLKELTKQTMKMVQEWIMRSIQKRAIRKAEQKAEEAVNEAEIAANNAKNLKLNTADASGAISNLVVKESKATGDAAAGISSGTSAAMSIGPWGAALVPIVVSLITGALVSGISQIGKAKTEVEAESGVSEAEASSFAKKKVVAGMMTYAEGSYPVMGSDGNQYNARKVNRWNTQVYSGAHYGIVGEKMPEMIIDGQTTNKMMTLRPDIYEEIMNLRDGIIRSNVKAYADGRYPASYTNVSRDQSRDNTELLDAIREMVAINTQLHTTLQSGIRADLVEDYSRDGVVNRMEQNRKWMQDHGLLGS